MNNNYLSECNVTMSNALVRSSHSLSLQEKRIICACIAKNNSRFGQKRDAHLAPLLKEMKFKVTAKDYNELFDVDMKHCYSILKESADNLLNRQFRIEEIRKGKKQYVKYNWLGFVRYAEDEGFIELAFSQYAYPHLNALNKLLTTYKLKNAQAFRSIYTWRLYELIMQFKDTRWLSISVDELRIALDTPSSYTWKDFRVKAIDRAVNELNKKLGLAMSYERFKTGRKITSLKFTWDKTL